MLNAKVYYPHLLETEVLKEMYSGSDNVPVSNDEVHSLLSSLPPLTTLIAYYTVPCELTEEGIVLNGRSAVLSYDALPGVIISSSHITVYAATIEPNSLKQTQSNDDSFVSYVYGALNTYILEDMVNSFQQNIEDQFGRELLRVSPGYGNLALNTQHDILNLLEKKGLPVILDLDTCNLMPLYSTTGVIGPLDRIY